MKERPILFSAPMVRALAGTKTQTRRLVKPQPQFRNDHHATDLRALLKHCPYGQPGDRLWVREAHSIGPGPGVALVPGETAGALRWPHVTYPADGAVLRRDERWKGAFGKLRPSIHMPRWACRLVLEVTEVRVERLQDISEADAIAEGIETSPSLAFPGRDVFCDYRVPHDPAEWFGNPVDSYRSLWEQINGPDSWRANPWVWTVSFRRLQEGGAT